MDVLSSIRSSAVVYIFAVVNVIDDLLSHTVLLSVAIAIVA